MIHAILTALRSIDFDGVKWAVDVANSSSFVHDLCYAAAELAVYVFVIILALLWWRPELEAKHHGSRKAALLAVMSMVLALAAKSVIAWVVYRNRPFIAHPDLMAMALRNVNDSSFPSGHSLISFAIASSLVFSGYRWLGWFSVLLACIVAAGRVSAGVHYPSDVIVGALIGIAAAWYLHREASSLKRYLPNVS